MPGELFVLDPAAGLFGAAAATGPRAAAGRFGAALAARTDFFATVAGTLLTSEADVFAAFALAADQAARLAAADDDPVDETVAGVAVTGVTIATDRFTVAVRVRTAAAAAGLSFPVPADLTEG